MDLDSVADELYQLDPGIFTATRNARSSEARKAGDRALADEIRALKRPSASAWELNQYAREQPDEVLALARVADDLRQAQASLSADQIRELSRTRQLLLAKAVERIRAQAADRGQRLTDSVSREIEDTLDAAAADQEAYAALRSGRLVRSLSYAGFGPVDVSGAVAATIVNRAPLEDRPLSPPAQSTEPQEARLRKQAAEEVNAARRASEEAEAARIRAHEEFEVVARRVATAEQEVRDLQSALDLVLNRLELDRADMARAEEELSTAEAQWNEARTHAEDKDAELGREAPR